MDPHEHLLGLAFSGLINSYFMTKRQQAIGRRVDLGQGIRGIHYEYEWQGERLASDYFFVWRVEPKTAASVIQAYGPAANHQLFVVADQLGLHREYLRLGWSALTPLNYLMVRGLDKLPVEPNGHLVTEASTPGSALLLNVIEGNDLILAEDLTDQKLRHYYASSEGIPAAMARLARLGRGMGWVSHVYTAPEYRGRGLARALMCKVLADQNQAGDILSLLLATELAHGLYRQLGYLDLAPVVNFRLMI